MKQPDIAAIKALGRMLTSNNPDERRFAKEQLEAYGLREPSVAKMTLLRAAEQGTLAAISQDDAASGLLTEENLREAHYGWNTYHTAAKHGHLNQIPKELFTAGSMQDRTCGKTFLHIAAEFGYLDQLPGELLTEENVLERCDYHSTVLHVAARFGHLDQISKELKTEANMLKTNMGGTVIFEAAKYGNLAQVPRELLTEANLQKAIKGNTVFQAAASSGNLSLIPKEFLTEENILQMDESNDNVIHNAANNGHLDQVPREFLTEENLTVEDGWGRTALEYAAEEECLDQLLGVEFSEDVISVVGKEWYERNKAVCASIAPSGTEKPVQEVVIESSTEAPSERFPMITGDDRTGKVYFKICTVEPKEITFLCGPQVKAGHLDGDCHDGLDATLEKLFKDYHFEVAVAENLHAIRPNSGQTMKELKEAVIAKVVRAGALNFTDGYPEEDVDIDV